MTWWEIAILWGVCAFVAAVIVIKRLEKSRRLESYRNRDPNEMYFDLDDAVVRFRVERGLANQGIVGDANIRDGKVLPAPSPWQRSEMARLLMQGYATGRALKDNDGLMLCVYVNDQWVPTEVSLGDLRSAAVMLEDR